VNWDKAKVNELYVDFLGFRVGQNEVHIHSDTIASIQSVPRPATLKQLHSYIATISFFRNHMPNLGEKLRPLQVMLRQHTPFKWSEENNRAWEEMKNYLSSTEVLTVPMWGEPFRIHIFSSVGCSVGAILMQVIDGQEKTISHFLHICNPAQEKYDDKILDCLATVVRLSSPGGEPYRGVLEEYRDNPCLWEVKNEWYHNKLKKNLAYDKVLKIYQELDPLSTLKELKKKIGAMRNAFQKENKKVNL